MCLNPDEIVIGRYEIINKLGSGGFGITYSAYDNNHSPPPIVVLKQIRITHANDDEEERDADYIRRLRLEADTLRSLQHPCIPEFYNSFEEDNYYYIVQEYIEGHDLSREIVAGEPIEEEEAESILREILEILQFVHEHKIIHRDVKPANIIRRRSNGKLYLIDFGAVKEIVTEHINASGIRSTKAIISQGYTPAEQSSGHPQFNSDIYALGMTIMRAVTGFSLNIICDPKRAPKRDNKCNYIWHDRAPQISCGFKEVISKMIRYNFHNRYHDIAEVLQDLNKEPIIITPDPNNPPIDEPSKSFFTRYRKQIKFVSIFIISCFTLTIFSIWGVPIIRQYFSDFTGTFSWNNACSLDQEDHISCGEETLDPLSRGADKNRATGLYQEQKYSDSLGHFKKSWQRESRNAETLIYLNNALLDANKIRAETISVAVPLNSNTEVTSMRSTSVAQDFLRGVAQVQTEVNLSLSNSNQEVANQLEKYSFLPERAINKNGSKGLKVIIADDANNKQQAKQIASKIAKNNNIKGIIGHYTSGRTLDTDGIYRQNNLAQISYGSTSKELSDISKSNFFRVVYTTEEEANSLLAYINQYNLEEKKIAIFYNPLSDYSFDLFNALNNKIDELEDPDIAVVRKFDIGDPENFYTNLALTQLDNLGINICLLLPDGLTSNALTKAIEVIEKDNGKRLMLGGNPLINPEVSNIKTDDIPLNLIVATPWHPTTDQESEFNKISNELWGESVNGNTAMAYDATLAMIEAIKQQKNPTRKGIIKELSNPEFHFKGATGWIEFNTSDKSKPDIHKNGDRQDFDPTLVRLHQCTDDSNKFVSLSLDNTQASALVCEKK